jgi:tetratricopeptide (TPR) repeat protein
MSAELELKFPDKAHYVVTLGTRKTAVLTFSDPLTAKDRKDLQWYLELYGAHSLADPDDAEARRIASKLNDWGKQLFEAVFAERTAQRIFDAFQDEKGVARLLTIDSDSPAILGLPWELLCDTSRSGIFLFNEHPRISIRRRLTGAEDGREPFEVEPKERLHLLFVVSRPEGSGFLDPRADASSVLDALDKHARDQVTWEFLRPPTLDALVERLEDREKPKVDVLHFDGHGVFDTDGGLPERLNRRSVKLEEVLSGQHLKDKKEEAPADSPANIGYLLFESPDGKADLVSAEKLGFNLHRREVPLVILSACQTATQGDNDEPLGSVAARLTAAGIPAVLAMTHSVLVHTTRALFGKFYEHLARRKAIGESLDLARLHLYSHPEKYEVRRDQKFEPLKLYDWFVPTLYQAGGDVPLIKEPRKGKPSKTVAEPASTKTNVPKRPETGFFGRKRELWEIERGFAGQARRITITGFGGQGKTALAQEAARWLTRTGMFEAAVFVDYSGVQAVDALPVAVSTIGTVLGQSLIDASAVQRALKETATLVVLDNLEAVAAEPLRELLDAASGWSEAGGSRVLLTTRSPDFGHADYRVGGTHLHRRIVLDGLGSKQAPDDALEWFAELWKLPPTPDWPTPGRDALIALFDLVRFHPLSLKVITEQLRTRRPAELGARLKALLAGNAAGPPPSASTEATLPELVASLKLSLDRLDAAAREVLPRLGVFQGGAFEDDLIAITGLGDPSPGLRAKLMALLPGLERGDPRALLEFQGKELPEGTPVPPELAESLTAEEFRQAAAAVREWITKNPPPPNLWLDLRRQLESAALLEAESVPGVGPLFLRFHPTLAPMLREQLSSEERARLATAHRERYAGLAHQLYQWDQRNPHAARAVAMRELPNLLHAVDAAFDAHDPDAVNFADSLIRFLDSFGLGREAKRLRTRVQAAAGDEGSRTWYLAQSQLGKHLMESGQLTEAIWLYQALLIRLGDTPSYDRANTLASIGRCYWDGGRSDLAAGQFRAGLAVSEKLEPSEEVKRLAAVLYTDLANVLAGIGQFIKARTEYEAGLKIKKEIGDTRGQGVTLIQLGTLAYREGNSGDALKNYQEALELFQQLREPRIEAIAWHQLGMVFQSTRQWDEAERHYREAARLKEANGLIGGQNGAATTWNQLAQVCMSSGKPEAAEAWYQKAIEVSRIGDDPSSLSLRLSNLADLLRSQPGRLAEARRWAEESLKLKQKLDPDAAEIWKTYNILAGIAEQEANLAADGPERARLRAQAKEHRRLAREAKRHYPGTRHELRQHAPLILATFLAAGDPAQGETLEDVLGDYGHEGWSRLVAAVRRIVGGEHDPEALCEDLDLEASMIVEAILSGLADPSTLSDLVPPESPED